VSNTEPVRPDADVDPPTPRRLVGTPGRVKSKWYVVIVGRKTGVFDDWYVVRSRSFLVLFPMIIVRLYTHSLVSGVSGNNYASFTTYDAAQVYYTANWDCRRVIRTSVQDERIFGSAEIAFDVNWRGY
jgi:hypothetical protein